MRSVAAALALVIGCAAPGLAADNTNATPLQPAAPPTPTSGLTTDTFVILESDTNYGPDMKDADTTARFYCATRGKVASFVVKEHPPEMRTQVLQAWALLTYRCIPEATSATLPFLENPPQ